MEEFIQWISGLYSQTSPLEIIIASAILLTFIMTRGKKNETKSGLYFPVIVLIFLILQMTYVVNFSFVTTLVFLCMSVLWWNNHNMRFYFRGYEQVKEPDFTFDALDILKDKPNDDLEKLRFYEYNTVNFGLFFFSLYTGIAYCFVQNNFSIRLEHLFGDILLRPASWLLYGIVAVWLFWLIKMILKMIKNNRNFDGDLLNARMFNPENINRIRMNRYLTNIPLIIFVFATRFLFVFSLPPFILVLWNELSFLQFIPVAIVVVAVCGVTLLNGEDLPIQKRAKERDYEKNKEWYDAMRDLMQKEYEAEKAEAREKRMAKQAASRRSGGINLGETGSRSDNGMSEGRNCIYYADSRYVGNQGTCTRFSRDCPYYVSCAKGNCASFISR